MYTPSCLQVAYEFLNREWMYLIYGEQKKTWYKNFKNWFDRWHFYILDSIKFKNINQFRSKKNYQFPIIVIITSLGAFLTAYKVMKILLSLEVKKSVMEFQWCRNENSNKTSPVFHENINESPQLTEDFTLGTSLTAIVKPTTRTSETWETIKAKDDQQSSGNEGISEHNYNDSGVPKKLFDDMHREEKADIKPLVKCTSSLYVVTSKDSLNAELCTEFITENAESQSKGNKKGMKIVSKVKNNMTFGSQESNSDVISTVFEETISHYQCSISAYTLPDTPALHKNSSYASGHFVENFPDLDLSPIPNLPPKNRDHEQSLKIETTDKEVEEAESKDTGRGSSHQTNLSDTGRGSSSQKYLSNSLNCSPRRSNKSPERFMTCFDFKTYLSDQNTPNFMNSKIPRLNFAAECEEAASNFSKLDAVDISGSKIPIPLRKSRTTNDSTEAELNSSPKSDSIQTEQKKGREVVDRLELKESEQSLERFVQLEIATGCYSASDFRNLQPPVSKS